MQVTAQKGKDGPSVTVEFDFGDTLEQTVELFGAEIVASHARRSLTVALQSFIRNQLDDGKAPEDIQALVNDWKPGQRKQGKSVEDRVAEMLNKLDPAQRQALLKDYKSKEKAARAEAA